MISTTKYPDIYQLLPHRGTMSLLDKIEHFDEELLRASTVVKEDAPFLDGHFPGYPILPGIVLIEMMYQACGLYGGLKALSEQEGESIDYSNGMVARSIGVDKLMFKKPVFPKDKLLIEVKPLKKVMNFSTYSGKVIIEASNSVCVSGKLTVFLGKTMNHE